MAILLARNSVAKYLQDKSSEMSEAAAWALVMLESKVHAAEALKIVLEPYRVTQRFERMVFHWKIPIDHYAELNAQFMSKCEKAERTMIRFQQSLGHSICQN